MTPARDPEHEPEKEGAFEERVANLGERLAKANRQRSVAEGGAAGEAELSGRGMAYGMRMAAELVAAVIVGGALGIGLDKWLGTWPWLFLLFFLLGFAAGVLNVVRAYGKIAREIAAATGGRIGQKLADDEDDA
jgi:ATP synthase protein I